MSNYIPLTQKACNSAITLCKSFNENGREAEKEKYRASLAWKNYVGLYMNRAECKEHDRQGCRGATWLTLARYPGRLQSPQCPYSFTLTLTRALKPLQGWKELSPAHFSHPTWLEFPIGCLLPRLTSTFSPPTTNNSNLRFFKSAIRCEFVTQFLYVPLIYWGLFPYAFTNIKKGHKRSVEFRDNRRLLKNR